jgi:hypothetical protein
MNVWNPVIRNREGLAEFYAEWGWSDGKPEPGFTAVLRVKDEARNLPFVLPPLLRSVSRVLIVDNGSSDGTPDISRSVAAQAGAADRLDVVTYPFAVSRCGTEHLNTPADSVHSLTYFYNWAFSQVHTTYSLKWDGDMLLTMEGERILTDLAWQLEGRSCRVYMMRVPLYVASPELGYADAAKRYFETWGWPNAESVYFAKGLDWEVVRFTAELPDQVLPDGACFELKWLDADEFSNWSDGEFDRNPRVERKAREWHVFSNLRDGRLVGGLVPFTSEGTGHVIDSVGRTSIPDWGTLRSAALADG